MSQINVSENHGRAASSPIARCPSPWCPLPARAGEESAGSPQAGRGRPQAREGRVSRASRRIRLGGLGVTVGCFGQALESIAGSERLAVGSARLATQVAVARLPAFQCRRGLTGCVHEAMVPRSGLVVAAVQWCRLGCWMRPCRMQVVDVLPLPGPPGPSV